MSDIAAKILSDNNMPCWTMSSIEFLLYLSCNVFLDIKFLEGSGRDVDRFLLHLLAHVDIFDGGLGRGAGEAKLAKLSTQGLGLTRWGVYFICHWLRVDNEVQTSS